MKQKSAERQIFEYCEKFEFLNDFKLKGDIKIELENGTVTMEYTNRSGTVYVDEFLEYDEENKEFLTIEQRTHLKYQFIEELEEKYQSLIDFNEIERDYYIDDRIDQNRLK